MSKLSTNQNYDLFSSVYARIFNERCYKVIRQVTAFVSTYEHACRTWVSLNIFIQKPRPSLAGRLSIYKEAFSRQAFRPNFPTQVKESLDMND